MNCHRETIKCIECGHEGDAAILLKGVKVVVDGVECIEPTEVMCTKCYRFYSMMSRKEW